MNGDLLKTPVDALAHWKYFDEQKKRKATEQRKKYLVEDAKRAGIEFDEATAKDEDYKALENALSERINADLGHMEGSEGDQDGDGDVNWGAPNMEMLGGLQGMFLFDPSGISG